MQRSGTLADWSRFRAAAGCRLAGDAEAETGLSLNVAEGPLLRVSLQLIGHERTVDATLFLGGIVGHDREEMIRREKGRI